MLGKATTLFRRRRKLFWAIGLLLAYTIFGFLILPWLVKVIGERQLRSNLNRQATIAKVKINPYTFSAAVQGLKILDKDGEPLLSWGEVFVDFELASFFGRPWVFKDIGITNAYARVQLNKDGTFNFSDLIEKFSQPSTEPRKPAKPLSLRIGQLRIGGARASITDLTPRVPFQRIVGPLQITLNGFETDPANRNPYAFTGRTETGETFSWSGHFFLDPIRSEGELSIGNVVLTNYAALYQDLVNFSIGNGVASLHGKYAVSLSPTNTLARVSEVGMELQDFQVLEPGAQEPVIQVPAFRFSGLEGDLSSRTVRMDSLELEGATIAVRRDAQQKINLLEMAQPAPSAATNAPGGILFLLQSITNAFQALIETTNTARLTLGRFAITNCAVAFRDEVPSTPVQLRVDQIQFAATNLSNVPGTNLTGELRMRWNTNGTVRVATEASLFPLNAQVDLQAKAIELHPLNPYLEPYVNVFVIASQVGLDGRVRIASDTNELPVVTFQGDSRLDNFATVGGPLAEELVKWDSVQFNGIQANLNPPTIAVSNLFVDGFYASVVLETNRALNLMSVLRASGSNAPPAPAPTVAAPPAKAGMRERVLGQFKDLMTRTNVSAEAGGARIDVTSVVLTNSEIRLADRSITPNVGLTLKAIHGAVRGISSAELRQADIDLFTSVDGTGPVELHGKFNPFNRQQASHFAILSRNVDLNPADPYSGRFLGYGLRKGKLTINLGYEVTARHLKGTNLIQIDQLTLGQKVDSPDATKLPVKLGLALLKDRSGRIELDVPVEGDLDDPEFRLGKVIWRTVGNIFTKLVTSPFSALGSLFGGGGAEEVRFQVFQPGQKELDDAGRKKLVALSKALYERPGLEVEIEGSIDPAQDLLALQRLQLEQALKVLKWKSLRPEEQSALPPDRVTLEAVERERWLSRLYTSVLAATPTNEVARTAALPEKRSTAAPLPPKLRESGLTGTGPPAPVNEMEQFLLGRMQIAPDQLAGLASSRIRAVQEFLIQEGNVEPQRLFPLEVQAGAVKTEGSKVFLNLR
jgi:hypothetical protein